MDYKIIQISDSKKDVRRFIKSQLDFYKGNPYFVAPIISEEVKNLDKINNPLYEHADFQLFIAEKDGQIIGRIAAIENKRHNEIHKDKVGFFGFFECVDNQDVANQLFDACKKWLLNRGLTSMRGPTNPTFNDVIGLVVEGFDSPPVTLSPYTHKYYLNLCENYGFKKAKDLYAYKVIRENYRTEKFIRMVEVIREHTHATIREVDFKNKTQLTKDIDVIKNIYNAAWQPNWGFVKMTNKEFDYLAKQLIQVGRSDFTLILEVKGKPIGMALALPDINQSLIFNKKGTLLGAGFCLLTKKKYVIGSRIIVLGVLPEHQRTGVDVLLYDYLGKTAEKIGIKYGDASWILEDNDMMNRGLTHTMNGDRYKTFRIYEKSIVD